MTRKWLLGSHPRVTPSDSKVTQKMTRSHFWVTFGLLWGRSGRVTFESLLGHFNAVCVSLGGRRLHNPERLQKIVRDYFLQSWPFVSFCGISLGPTIGQRIMGETKVTKREKGSNCFLRFPAVFCGFLRASAALNTYLADQGPNLQKSAKIFDKLPFLPFSLSHLALPDTKQRPKTFGNILSPAVS